MKHLVIFVAGIFLNAFLLGYSKMVKCEICGKEFSANNKFSQHITKYHNLSKQDYYDKYLKTRRTRRKWQ